MEKIFHQQQIYIKLIHYLKNLDNGHYNLK